jgi:hypothetical protein
MLQWLTFISATLAAGFQGRRAVQAWLYDQRERRAGRRAELAGWSQTGVDTWIVQLAAAAAPADPAQRSATGTVTDCGRDSEPDQNQADRLRRYLEDHQYLSRNPTPAELETLKRAAQDSGRLTVTRARRRRLVT